MTEIFKKILTLADATTVRLTPEKLPWMWGEGLLMHALGQLDTFLGKDRYLFFIQRYVDHHLAIGLRVDQSDTLAPILASYYLQKKTGDARYATLTDRGLTYIQNAKKILENMPNHLGHSLEGRLYPKSIWVDSLMMYGVFTSLYAKNEGIGWFMDYAKSQPLLFEKYLKDPIDGRFTHSYWVKQKKQHPKKLYWGRGNGWVVAALSMMLENMEQVEEKSEELNTRTLNERGVASGGQQDSAFKEAVRIFKEVSLALLPYQRDDGYFESLLNKPGKSLKESSATALIAAGWLNGNRCGFLDGRFVEPAGKALEAVVKDLDFVDGLLSMNGISGPTIPLHVFPDWGYKIQYRLQKSRDWSYGLAALFFAGIAYQKLQDSISPCKS